MKKTDKIMHDNSSSSCKAAAARDGKKKCFIAITVILMFIMVFAAGCSDEREKVEPKDSAIVIADFDTWQTGFQLMRFVNNFGEASMNTDAKYVKDGVGSAKLQPLGGYSMRNNPTMYFPFESALFDFNYCNFSKAEKITVDIMNTEDKTVNVTMGLVGAIPNASSIDKASRYARKLSPGWTNIEYLFDLNTINITYDITDIKGVYFEFENAGSRDLADAPVLYMDNLKLYEFDAPVEIKNMIQLEKNEICDFEKAYQQNIITGEADKQKCMPEVSVVGSVGSILPSSGNKMLSVRAGAGDKAEATWPKIVIPEKIMQASNMKKIDASAYSKTYFAFDIYNDSNKSITFFPEFYAKGGSGWQPFNCTASPNTWVTVKFSFKDISRANLAEPGFFKLAWAEFTSAYNPEIKFFLDNFRIIQE